MRRLKGLVLTFSLLVSAFMPAFVGHASADFNPNLLMDDIVFNNYTSMSAADIDTWLNTNFGSNSCISTSHGFAAPEPVGYSPSSGFSYGGAVSAGTVIYNVAHVYGLNPQVILATLQKEQSLVTGGAGCTILGDSGAMGYGCPDGGTTYDYPRDGALAAPLFYYNGQPITSVSGTCVNSSKKVGFSQQVVVAAWQLKFDQQRSEGNMGWNVQVSNFPHAGNVWDNSDDPQACYTHRMTQGFYQTCPSGSAASFDGLYTIDNTTVHMDTGPTAALYNYTPHFHGNQNFVTYFTAWFGGTISSTYYSCHNASNVSGAPTGEHVVASKVSQGVDNLRLVIPNNTATSCVEVHTWLNNGLYNTWVQHIATNSPAVDPRSQRVNSADGNGDGFGEMYKVDYSNTGSGMVEVHGWTPSVQGWASHIASNRPGLSLADSEVIMAHPNGGGDNSFLVQYRNTGSHRLEIHQWNYNLQQWVSHIATNYGEVDPATAQVVAADTNGDGKDEFYLVNYNGQSGRIEIHGWSSNFQQWVSHIASNSPGVTHVDASGNPVEDVITADTNGDGKDEFYKIDYTGTASGRVEIHRWAPGFQQWASHIASNQSSF